MDGPLRAALLRRRRDHPLRGTGAGRSGTDGQANRRSAARRLEERRRRSATGRADGDHPRRFLAQWKRIRQRASRRSASPVLDSARRLGPRVGLARG